MLPKVSIASHDTLFWRYNEKNIGNQFLATIEAIYYFYQVFPIGVRWWVCCG